MEQKKIYSKINEFTEFYLSLFKKYDNTNRNNRIKYLHNEFIDNFLKIIYPLLSDEEKNKNFGPKNNDLKHIIENEINKNKKEKIFFDKVINLCNIYNNDFKISLAHKKKIKNSAESAIREIDKKIDSMKELKSQPTLEYFLEKKRTFTDDLIEKIEESVGNTINDWVLNEINNEEKITSRFCAYLKNNIKECEIFVKEFDRKKSNTESGENENGCDIFMTIDCKKCNGKRALMIQSKRERENYIICDNKNQMLKFYKNVIDKIRVQYYKMNYYSKNDLGKWLFVYTKNGFFVYSFSEILENNEVCEIKGTSFIDFWKGFFNCLIGIKSQKDIKSLLKKFKLSS